MEKPSPRSSSNILPSKIDIINILEFMTFEIKEKIFSNNTNPLEVKYKLYKDFTSFLLDIQAVLSPYKKSILTPELIKRLNKYEFIQILDYAVENNKGDQEVIMFKYFYKSSGESRCTGLEGSWLPTDIIPLRDDGTISKAEDSCLHQLRVSNKFTDEGKGKYKYITEESILENYRYMNSTYARIGKYFEKLGDRIYTESK